MVIIAASGMATGGRVVHHIKAFAPHKRNTMLFAGYQAGGTRGRQLMVGGATSVRIHGEEVPIRAEVAMLDSLSAHADAGEIVQWLARHGFKAAAAHHRSSPTAEPAASRRPAPAHRPASMNWAGLTHMPLPQDRGTPTLQHVGQQRHVERPTNLGHFFHRLGRFNEQAICTGAQVTFTPAQSLIHAHNLPGIGARNDEGVRIHALASGSADLAFHVFSSDQRLAGDVAAALGADLVLKEQGLGPQAFQGMHQVHDVLVVAIAVVGINQRGQRRHRQNVPVGIGKLAATQQPNVGQSIADASDRKPANEKSLEPGLLDQHGRQRIVCTRQYQGAF
jgi:hypothetical protein